MAYSVPSGKGKSFASEIAHDLLFDDLRNKDPGKKADREQDEKTASAGTKGGHASRTAGQRSSGAGTTQTGMPGAFLAAVGDVSDQTVDPEMSELMACLDGTGGGSTGVMG